jgi:DNA-binding Lrp family transcriptional regulator
MDDTDRLILNRIQSDFPITPRPYDEIGKQAGISEDEVMARLTHLKDKQIIRRIGGNFVPEKLGYVSTLCAAQVPENRIQDFMTAVNRFPGVTHNYLRDDPFNIWFTFIARSMDEIKANLEKIASETGITRILNLPATRTFKIKAQFDL